MWLPLLPSLLSSDRPLCDNQVLSITANYCAHFTDVTSAGNSDTSHVAVLHNCTVIPGLRKCRLLHIHACEKCRFFIHMNKESKYMKIYYIVQQNKKSSLRLIQDTLKSSSTSSSSFTLCLWSPRSMGTPISFCSASRLVWLM